MTTKQELLDEATAKGIAVPEGATKADIEELLNDADPNRGPVVASTETRPLADDTAGAGEDAIDDDGVAQHHHESGLGPVLSPAGAHRHGPGLPEHNHPVQDLPGGPDVVNPLPNADDAGTKRAPTKSVKVDRDQTVVFRDQLLELKAGQTVDGELAEYLAASGADVS